MTKWPHSHAARNKSTSRDTLASILGRENPSATRRVSRLCHCAVTCYYKRVPSLCFSTRSAAKRDMRLTHLNPQSARPKCQTAAVQEGSVSRFFATKVGLAAETISRYLNIQSMPLGEEQKRWKEKLQKPIS